MSQPFHCAVVIGIKILFVVSIGLVDADGVPHGGLFGTAVATMGMLSTAVCVHRDASVTMLER